MYLKLNNSDKEEEEVVEIARNPWKLKRAAQWQRRKKRQKRNVIGDNQRNCRQRQRQWTAVTTTSK